VLGERDVQPSDLELEQMRALVHQGMEEGALGLTTALIYAPATYAKTPELIALAQESARCGGIYTAHMRSEGDRIEAAIQETIDIARASGAPAEIYHLKVAGRDNWGKLDRVIAMIDQARASGIRISANMYTYTAGATGLDAAMPSWVQDGGLEAWIERLKDPAIRARVIAEMRIRTRPPGKISMPRPARGTLLLEFKNPKLKPLTGKSLAEVASSVACRRRMRPLTWSSKTGPVGVAYFLMNEDNIRRQVALSWVSFGSDEAGDAPEGVFAVGGPPARVRQFRAGVCPVRPQRACAEHGSGGAQAHLTSGRQPLAPSIGAGSRPGPMRMSWCLTRTRFRITRPTIDPTSSAPA
jgi:N-acyl-D-amino-acid deacylase